MKRNPPAKLLGFYERVLAMEEATSNVKGVELDVQESSKLSKGLRSLPDLKSEWFQKWIREWVARSRHVA
jgi:hypothetical protein